MPIRAQRFVKAARSQFVLASILIGAAGSVAPQTPANRPSFDFSGAIESAQSMPRLHSLLVSWRGDLVFEQYFNGRTATDLGNVKSVSKSIISALIGIAIDQGHIAGVDQPIGDYFHDDLEGDNADAKRAITIGQLLTMQAGLETTSNRNYGAWVQSANWVQWSLERPFDDAPGGRMIYSTGNTHLLSAIIQRATGMSTLQFARRSLGEPLGFRIAPWPRDPQGIYFGGNDMELTPRQMMAIGQLYIDGGAAGGHNLLPRSWIDASFVPRTESEREPGRYYGYGWWIRDMVGFRTPYAWGYGGQFILLVPEIDLVVVTTSSSNPGPDRRRHTRRIYAFAEYEVIAAAARALGVPIRHRASLVLPGN